MKQPKAHNFLLRLKTVFGGHMDELLIRGWILIIIGALLIGSGGVFTTLGWSRLGDRAKKHSLIKSVVREWLINDGLISAITDKAYQVNSSFAERQYPRFKTTALNGVLISGLFESGSKKNVLFMRKVADYETVITEANFRLEMIHAQITHEQNENTVADTIKEFTLKDKVFQNFMRQHRYIKEVLQKNFSWVDLENSFSKHKETLSKDYQF